jgi:indolepyruvate ferredoxin oxidoreductase
MSRRGTTRMLVNLNETMTGEFTRHPDLAFPASALRDSIAEAAGRDRVEFVDATNAARKLFGDAMASNMFMLGFAYQRGMIPVGADAIAGAIELNGASVASNVDAFTWGRRFAIAPSAAEHLIGSGSRAQMSLKQTTSLDEMVERRVAHLTAYQNAGYAARYRERVESVRRWERAVAPRSEAVTRAVAQTLFKLLAYKDEYEVARLLSAREFVDGLREQFEGPFRLAFNLAPPLLTRRADNGEPRKREFGAWLMPVMRLLAHGKVLRGTVFDPFGHTSERRMEQLWIRRYEATIAAIIEHGNARNHALAIQAASVADKIRGYGHVKERNFQALDQEWKDAVDALKARTIIPLREVA